MTNKKGSIAKSEKKDDMNRLIIVVAIVVMSLLIDGSVCYVVSNI